MPQGVVKFFNSAKGFGFISPEDGSSDVFVHVSALHNSGLEVLNDGDQVSFELEQDRRSGKLAAVDLRVTGRGVAPVRRDPPRQGGPGRPSGRPIGGGPRESAGSGSGIVKWFNATKGFGFIQPNSGGEDVFVHISTVERAGLSELQEGQQVSFDLEQDRRTGKLAAANLRAESA